MELIVPFLLFCQALGAFVGAFFAVQAELAYVRAVRDRKIDHAERLHLNASLRGLRFGMSILLLSSLALVAVAYTLRIGERSLLSENYWALVVLALLITAISWALSRKRISFAFGSATAFAGWWFLVFLTLDQIPPLSIGTATAFFAIATAIFYALLTYARSLLAHRK